jgi:CheY-like chemotaxis protein
VKFTPSGGTVDVQLSARGRHAWIVVRDNGHGIDTGLLPYVFDRFRQGDASSARREGGLGLGLALVRDLVELHGGSVSVESGGLGQGSAFRVELPALLGNEWNVTQPAAAAVAARPARLDGVRVMVLDDEADSRELVVMALRQYGAEVSAAASPVEAFDLIAGVDAGRRPQVVVANVGIPIESGFAFIRQLRALDAARDARIPAVAVTGYAHTGDRVRLLEAGFQSHVAKPADPSAIVAAVATALRASV